MARQSRLVDLVRVRETETPIHELIQFCESECGFGHAS